jgi:hypothetical protein
MARRGMAGAGGRAVRHRLVVLAAVLAALPATARAQGATDLFLLEIREADGRIQVERVRRLTDRDGYDNQPHFLPGRALLYTSIDATGQADIHRIDLASGRTTNLTRTSPESEYSATPMPGGERFSVVRVEADSTQRLWSFGMEGGDARLVIEDVAPVGYHAWIDADWLALFVLGSPSTLRVAGLRSGEVRVVAQNIGRALHRIPGRQAVSVVRREGQGPGWIEAFDPATGAFERLAPEVDGNEYHAWTPSGILVSARGSVLLQWDARAGGEWIEIADLSASGLRGLSRIAASPDGRSLAVVASRE